ncbi:type II toxin-antitoxin system MqsR family toxin [Desulforegula conservatrix]|uniref:type II toxin-antitoxin system MqsR family toxin n=1 Tax=Desulforegula conservatrix TaxID=153026 RepID=UPI0004266921|nr:type II toxin-antitoxin system MqsR family toxin [Desulforegula conservatrix]
MDQKHKAASEFLKEFKKIASSRGIDVVPRRENNSALIEFGLTEKNRKEEILKLTSANYYRGPEADRDRPGEIWEFRMDIDDIEVYIKLKIADVEGTDGTKIAKCLSFHKAKFPMS